MSRRGAHRARVIGDRLWDEHGDLWLGVRGTWTEEAEIDRLLPLGVPVVLHGFGRPFRSLGAQEARRFWSVSRPHFEVPGKRGAEPDSEGLRYAAQTWTREGRQLLGFVEIC